MDIHDPDVIAYLFPAAGQGKIGALETIYHAANASRFLPPRLRQQQSSSEMSDRDDRDSTEEPDSDELEYQPCLALRFSEPPRYRQGLVAGQSPQTQLRLHVGMVHFAFSFDERNLLVLKDLSSVFEPATHNGESRGSNTCGLVWTACGPPTQDGSVSIIKVTDSLQFRLFLPNCNTTSQIYINKVIRFKQQAAAAVDLFSNREVGGGMQPPRNVPVLRKLYWAKEIGRGGFAVVSQFWDLTARKVYALKEPLPGPLRGNWKAEVEIMMGVSHENIVTLRRAVFTPRPQLYFDYVPGGSLEEYKVTTPVQRAQIAVQLLSGLAYLHDTKSIAHRDIKPANVLVQDWKPDRVHVKLGDFGLSKQTNALNTFCGTPVYSAPEVFPSPRGRPSYNKSTRYNQLVDIWSLGVLLVQLECGSVPKFVEDNGFDGVLWGSVMIRFAQNYQAIYGPTDLLSLVLIHMLLIDPKNRLPAKKCYEKALQVLHKVVQNNLTTSKALRAPSVSGRASTSGHKGIPNGMTSVHVAGLKRPNAPSSSTKSYSVFGAFRKKPRQG